MAWRGGGGVKLAFAIVGSKRKLAEEGDDANLHIDTAESLEYIQLL